MVYEPNTIMVMFTYIRDNFIDWMKYLNTSNGIKWTNRRYIKDVSNLYKGKKNYGFSYVNYLKS